MATPHAKKIVMDLLAKTKAETSQYGLGDIIAGTDDLLDDILIAPAYNDAEKAEWKAWFAGLESIPVKGEFRRDTGQLPCVFVLRGGDNEPQRGGYLSDYIGEEQETYDTVTTIRGAKFREVLTIEIWSGGAEAPAVRDVLYLIVRELLLRARVYLHTAGMEVVEWTGGMDGQLERPEHNPHLVHTAHATLSYQVDVTWREKQDAILDVDGRHESYDGGRVFVGEFEDF